MYASLDMIRKIKQLNREIDKLDSQIKKATTELVQRAKFKTKRSRLISLKDLLLKQWHQVN